MSERDVQMAKRPEPAFDQPWHAQVFALTVHLNENGVFSWGDWVWRFSATLRRHGLAKDLNGGEDYFAAWLETLELYLAEVGTVAAEDAVDMRLKWETAYLATPHGQPVRLAESTARKG
ncbi:nitrile hydratase accessory protein [Phaeobacter gallaeciensis]|uniref:Nitrile hydratase accessory protein n=1 Tax=Phaeobacter gallaeciensis TaxID=60890 RepID=A0AAC9Z7D0_9RHOB|nr:nitrile hydratase accessory protein [Phaeobacter gallaeciensis]AHD08779.1 nitrile hydratase accessory protein [Phaeobacter gallaeciensis DSM 26640]ATE92045.1 nitrile hydratase accessory protein [Phaeobacter gallaeciensis]ATE98131.1 nitrile hydratase accessory protein [Phaeobacter gallaeciensis]ATF00661.1 nitrile hydratase accessory protein [Phaeobacter gallaeciensis]ATF05092.1 nitrile hydratase accessory protein [Phaeobacter gallaeciensis]